MESLAQLIPTKTLLAVLIGSFFPTIVAYFTVVKAKKELIVEKVKYEAGDFAGDIKEAFELTIDSLEYLFDAVEGLVEGLSPESEAGSLLSEDEKKDSLKMAEAAKEAAAKALEELKESVVIGD